MVELNPDSFVTFQQFRPPWLVSENRQADEDAEMIDVEPGSNAASPPDVVETNATEPGRLIIAVDFGTTCSSVAYAVIGTNKPREEMDLRDIKCISKYPNHASVFTGTYDPQDAREDVPTELWYNAPVLESQTSATSLAQSRPQEPKVTREQDCDMDGEFTDDEDDRSSPYLWGYGVQKHLSRMDVAKDNTMRIARFKLLLDENSEATSNLRRKLEQTTARLKKQHLIEGNGDLIRDFLRQLFSYTKTVLQQSEVLVENMPIEFVLCVPAVWPSQANRVMQVALSEAIKLSALGSLKDGGLDNLFIVSEPEAAAACVLEENNYDVKTNEAVVIIDAGGGTVDAVTYEIGSVKPLRLAAEVVPSETRLCGASYINERYEKLLLDRLKDEGDLAVNGKTIQSIVEAKVVEFEIGVKRRINTERERFGAGWITIDNLQEDGVKRFLQNRLCFNRQEMKDVFEGSLAGTAQLLRNQLQGAKDKGRDVQLIDPKKVILIGGFAQSPALLARLKSVLRQERNNLGQEIRLLHSVGAKKTSTVVARGAALRAFDKTHGPARITSCSYGFSITENYDPDRIEHKGVDFIVDEVDGERYIDRTIRWLIKKDDELKHYKEFPAITVKHTFAADVNELLCADAVYVSDFRHESHYRNSHPKNKGAELAGIILTNMTFLKDKKLIKLEKPSASSKHKGPKAPKHWAVEFQLVMVIEGRNLRYEARWPVPKHANERPEVQKSGQISIAAAFKPGTA